MKSLDLFVCLQRHLSVNPKHFCSKTPTFFIFIKFGPCSYLTEIISCTQHDYNSLLLGQSVCQSVLILLSSPLELTASSNLVQTSLQPTQESQQTRHYKNLSVCMQRHPYVFPPSPCPSPSPAPKQCLQFIIKGKYEEVRHIFSHSTFAFSCQSTQPLMLHLYIAVDKVTSYASQQMVAVKYATKE